MPAPAFKNILVGLLNDPTPPSSALDFAFDLAALSDAHLTVEVDATEDMPVGAMNYEAAFMVTAVNDRFQGDAQALAARVRASASASRVSCRVLTWAATPLALTRNFASLGRTHDLAILDARYGAAGTMHAYIEAALFETGRPVMVIPEPVRRCSFKRCIVLWDGSIEAARAINDALPLLRCMEAVQIVSVQRLGANDRLEGVGLHMQRHGITTTSVALPTTGNDVGHTIISHVGEVQPDLIVMGAYSHSRVREWLLGGTTRAMLRDCPAALFMSH